jgi:hypothetical protein
MNLTAESKKLEQAWEAMKEKQLDRRTREILHDLGISQIMPEQTTISECRAIVSDSNQFPKEVS